MGGSNRRRGVVRITSGQMPEPGLFSGTVALRVCIEPSNSLSLVYLQTDVHKSEAESVRIKKMKAVKILYSWIALREC